ncbi:PEP-CTERM sorting domain-containing protein [Sandarakinorhabdus oryzae]|uniref:PEP-CTERM sorting domain-containing protein n=1 Tax=Sandarakinorhabdus oryzae TaxID=2675220 RepID=UPI0012E10975|nr:PEP-CTERM sorting domain-containing protein [Sandarakinorhabdus oryzae]
MLKPFIIGAAAFSLASAAQATTEIATTARGVFSNVRAVGQPLTLVGPIASVGGRTSPGYSLNGGVASLSAPVSLGTVSLVTAGLDIGTGLITTTASADGTTPADTTSGSATATVNNLAVSLFTSTLGVPTSIIGLTADQVQSQSNISTANQVVALTGQSNFTNLNLTVAGVPILALGSNAQVGVNFVAYDLAGLKITFNQQFTSNFDSTRLLVTNAIGISFTNYLLGGRSLNGDLIIGQTVAEYQGSAPIPEPAAWAQLIAGLALAGAARRRQQRKTKLARD